MMAKLSVNERILRAINVVIEETEADPNALTHTRGGSINPGAAKLEMIQDLLRLNYDV